MLGRKHTRSERPGTARPARGLEWPRTSTAAFACLSILAVAIGLYQPIGAAELRLKPTAEVTGSLVLLGDLAEVLSSDAAAAATLATIELFPAPATGTSRYVRLRELQDLLHFRGVNLVDHRFSGASLVEVRSGGALPAERPTAPLGMAQQRLASQRAAKAILDHLRTVAGATDTWLVRVQLDEQQAKRIVVHDARLSASGGTPPWTAAQRFHLEWDAGNESGTFIVDVEVEAPRQVVVATRALARGALVNADDVRLEAAAGDSVDTGPCTSLDEVLGKEAIRAIRAGQWLTADDVRAPIVVRRGDVITVYVRSPGVQVRTTARAKQDGALGDLISVESLLDRRSYYAQVSGIQTAEVYARAVSAAGGARVPPDSPQTTGGTR